MNIRKGPKRKKLGDLIERACIAGGLLVLFLGGVFQVVVYGLPLGNRERDMKQVLNGIGMVVIVSAILLFGKLFDLFLKYLDERHGSFKKEIDSRKWPIPMFRTVKRTLINMSMKSVLIAWDVITAVIVISMLITLSVAVSEGDTDTDFIHLFLGGVLVFLNCMVIRLFILLFYYLRNYTGRMLHYSEKYVGIRDKDKLLKDLERSLKEELVYYSPQWIITKNFFMAWCDLDTCFHPITIPVNEMCHLKYEIRTRRIKRTVVESAVIVCRLRNGKSVDLYVGNRFKINVIWKVLRFFQIPFENTLALEEHYEAPFEITVTAPVSADGIFEQSELEVVIKNMHPNDLKRIYGLLESGKKVEAIKEIREATGLGLLEAKQIADEYSRKLQ